MAYSGPGLKVSGNEHLFCNILWLTYLTVEFMLGSFLFIGVIVIYLPVTDEQYLTKLMGIACAQTYLCTIDCGILLGAKA